MYMYVCHVCMSKYIYLHELHCTYITQDTKIEDPHHHARDKVDDVHDVTNHHDEVPFVSAW